ncbi:MAG: D-3-phosphoglycerate dehydrogenase / 2-oxoglutarate reductase [Gaiellales bacterium]|nr:D-3-phosphoglycerate dehydrogenase / 2-oxoglutarate reductase [Gaiellales bacterium]MDX6598209.1 D-3-phosphoglycerate dehydrogenase / 2-oxoglutarate reductase [Gaiellales bacterium]
MTGGTEPHRIWFEREPPEIYHALLDGTAVIAGSGARDSSPLSGVAGAHAVIASSRVQYDADFMDRAPSLRVISRTGIGLDNVRIPEATERGIAICHTPGAPTISTAEHAFALLLACAKALPQTARAMRAGPEDFFNTYDGIELDGLCLGIVGLGQIGRRVARFAQAIGMRVVAFDPLLGPAEASELRVTLTSTLEALLAEADAVSLHAPLTPGTMRLMDERRIGLMRPGAILINTARGGLVDEPALAAALEAGHLRSAGLDVFEVEPPHPDNPLLHRDDVIATPHIAGATAAGRDRLWRTAIAQALQVLADERPPGLANPEVWTAGGAR